MTQCTAIDDGGGEVTFNPQAPGTPTRHGIDASHGLNGISCPSSSQCTASDFTGGGVASRPAG